MTRYSAVDLESDYGEVLPDGRISTGNPRTCGIEFSVWRLNDSAVAFFSAVPLSWPEATAVGAEALVALASLLVVDGVVMISGTSPSAAPTELLAAALATGAVGFGLVPVEKPLLQVQVGGQTFRVEVDYGNPELDPRWGVVVTPLGT